jgi:Tfp pilus assembly protein PilZ
VCFKKKDKRQNKRTEIELKVTPIGLSRNLSPKGMFITTTKTYPIGSLIELCFYLPETTTKISAISKVIWTDDSVLTSGIGIDFIRFTSGSSNLIRDYLDQRKDISNG